MLKLDLAETDGVSEDSDSSDLMALPSRVIKEVEGKVEGKVEEQQECYTNQSFIMESGRRIGRWFSQPNILEKENGGEKGSTASISTAADLKKRRRMVRRLVEKNGGLRVACVGVPDRSLQP